ncbi:carbohydrate ABC transporter permease [Sediminispirochaeta smaragdinae]|uniref:Binding-protein-dependent transport systems inner membrane component n=1 Tax=Sediminispirochaeta smaragdinae (strain DSM 11293 / JCM 15392 / SEBR 4228) TaxID=573413 RepID=E1R3U0_SEDSS|nr:carbohydrate ABC transporter permease [Sediminispirochaeta smaragdinae]ADK82061.1 binding-protein-dependent transport systems inner membrane component [Sediminispirochaeta smaragdinae DSM 11293]
MIKKNQIIHNTFFCIFLFCFILLVFFPFYWMVNTSMKTENQLMMTPATLVPLDHISMKFLPSSINYQAVLKNTLFLHSIANSIIVAGVVTLVSLLLGSFSAYALGKLYFRGKKIILYLILTMTMFPRVSVLSGLYSVIRFLHISAIQSMILSYFLFTLPFTVWVMTSYYRQLPSSLLEAAYVDGATPFQSFFDILLPLTIPAAVTTGLLAFIAAWNEYLFALTFSSVSPKSRTIPVAIAMFSGTVSRQYPFGEIMAASVVITLPLLILVIVFQKKLVAGLTSGAIKQ